MVAHNLTSKDTVTTGLIAGTMVEGAKGWLPVEDLRIGDAVHSYDGGLVRVLGLDRQWITPGRGGDLMHLPGGALDNCSDLGSGLIDHNQKMTIAAMAMADMKVWAQRS